MKSKQYIGTIKELIDDLYLCVFDSKCDIDELMKFVVKSMDFFKNYCCSIDDVETKAGNKQSLSVVFDDTKVKNAEDLGKNSTVNKIITCINSSITEYLKMNSAKSLLKNCEEYLAALKSYSTPNSMPYNFHRLEKLVRIMEEMLNYDLTLNSSFNWVVTSFMFHIIYVNITSTLHHLHNLSSCILCYNKEDNVSSLANLFDSKRLFISSFMTEILPKILAFNTSIDNGLVMFCGKAITEEHYRPLFDILSKYNNNSLTANDMKCFMINHSHHFIHIVSSPLLAGAKVPAITAPSKDLETIKTMPAITANIGSIKDQEKRDRKEQLGSIMPGDKVYKKMLLLKFVALLEKCVQAYKDKKPPATAMVVNLFEGTKKISIKDGQVIVNK